MYPPIVCNCGFALGDKYEAFKALRTREYQRHFEKTGKYVEPEKIALSEEMRVDLRGVFQTLKIRQPCCIARMMTAVEFRTLY